MSRLLTLSVGMVFAGVSLAAAAAPTAAESRAARGVETATLLFAELPDVDNEFVRFTRSIASGALTRLSTSTTFEALLAPGGVTLNCALSGTLNARIVNHWPRVLQLDWSHCVSMEFGMRADVHGPGEITLTESSLEPASVLSIRLGDRDRDHVVDEVPATPQPWWGGQVTSRNLRLTGLLPMTREFPQGEFLGRYLAELKGFTSRAQRIPEVDGSGQPSAEFYNYTFTRTTDGALVTGAYSVEGRETLHEAGLIAGKVSMSYTFPTRPSQPTFTLSKWFKGTGLLMRRKFNYDTTRYWSWVDGKVEGDFNQFWPIGCTGADTYTFRTRDALTRPPLAPTAEQFDGGELLIDGKTVAKFSATGANPVDFMGHVELRVPGAGTFNYDYPSSLFRGSLNEAGRCTF